MVKLNLKNKFAFLNKSKASNSINSTLGLEENINTSATWFQSMEPVIYAKKNGNKLYKFKKIIINHEDTKTFKELLMSINILGIWLCGFQSFYYLFGFSFI